MNLLMSLVVPDLITNSYFLRLACTGRRGLARV
jgi:hypothetical protein